MGIIELALIAIGLAMDAFAVSICMGMTMPKATAKKALTAGLYFGAFQAGMPVIGYYTATLIADKIVAYDHWVAFGLLCFLGGKMIVSSLQKADCPDNEVSLSFAKMLPPAIATSIDALAVGVSFAFLRVDIVPAVLLIGIITLVFSMLGIKIGNLFGLRFRSKAEFAGGIILILIGLKILFEHLEVLSL